MSKPSSKARRAWQRKFTKSLMRSMQEFFLAKIAAGAIPDEWDGFEMRQWLADRFSHEVRAGKMDRRRTKAYHAVVNENNL